MFSRRYTKIALGVLTLATACATARATEVVQGRVVSAGNRHITIERENRSTLSFHLASGASVTKDGRAAKLEELTRRDRATITTDNKMKAILVVARSMPAVGAPAARVGVRIQLVRWTPAGVTLDSHR